MLDYQRISGSQKFGGARTVLTGTVYGVTSGRFNLPSDRVPASGVGLIPAGTPISVNDETRAADIHYAFEVVGGTTTAIQVNKSLEGTRAKVGMFVMVAPETIDGTGTAVAITAVNTSNVAYDVLTTAALTGGSTVGAILVEATAAGADASIKVKPNAISFYDVVKHPLNVETTIDGLFIQVDGVLLERRIPPIAPAVKAHLSDPNGGNVYIRYSKSKE